MIVGMRTRAQAERVAELIGGTHLVGKPKRDGSTPMSRYVAVGADFEARRAAVESVSVLFDLLARAVERRTLAWQTAGRRERGAPVREEILAGAPAPA